MCMVTSANPIRGIWSSVQVSITDDDVACSGSFSNDEGSNGFTADCSGAAGNGDACTLTLSAGYGGGSVSCSTSDGSYTVVAATEEGLGAAMVYTLCEAAVEWLQANNKAPHTPIVAASVGVA